MFEGFKGSWYAIKYGRNANKIEEAYKFSLENSFFLCKHCKQELGLLHEIKIMDFLKHMEVLHKDKVDMKEVEKFKALFKRMER